ncbi:hypothetical protein SRHO_G00180380 [Serrasalmus rhombeus]
MSCTYTYPNDYSVQKAFWTKQWPANNIEPPSLLDHPEFRGRVQYLRDKKHDCTLRLRDVRETDQSKYYFRFTTDQPGGKYQGAGGVDLSVTDLQVEVPERVMEGDQVTLTCKTTCSLTVTPTFTWYRNGHRLSSRTDQLHLQPISREDAGRYRCGVLGQNLHSPEVTLNVRYLQVEVPERVIEGDKVTLTCKTSFSLSYRPTFIWYRNGHRLSSRTDQLHLQPVSSDNKDRYRCAVLDQNIYSPVVTLNVRYGPKSVSVSISPSSEIVEGSSVTLTCSSDANPPVGYNWIKGTSSVGKGETYTMKKISSVDSGEYKCRSSNEHGVKYSTALTLNVLYPPKSVSVSISPSGEIVEGRSVTLTCSSDANPPVQNYTWFKGTSLVVKGETYTMKNISSVDSGQYKCRSSNEHGEKLSEALTLNVLYPPKSISVSISPSGEIVQGSSVTLTCSSDANPPVQNYTWFKKPNKGALQKSTSQIYSISNISSADSGEYHCMATNKHGSKYSEYKSLTVLYAPNKVLVSINETSEGSSVNLTCSSDANPPVQNYTWFKEGGSSPVGSGHSYRALQSGSYYCEAQNEYGSQKSAAVTVTVKGISDVEKPGNQCSNLETPGLGAPPRDTTPGPDPANQQNVEASVQDQHHKVVEKTEGDDVQYASVRFICTGTNNKTAASTHHDVSVIYSIMK